jgi:hypothetical protein
MDPVVHGLESTMDLCIRQLTKLCCFRFSCVTAGWEHIYDYLGHVLGSSGVYTGIAMHLGHYPRHIDFMTSFGQKSQVEGFFNPAYWIRFITAGTALWLQSLPQETHSPCCDLSHLGGDGTGIGVCTTEVFNLKPIWQPDDFVTAQPISWGRLDRCVVPSPTTLPDKKRREIAAAKSFCKAILANKPDFREQNRVSLISHKDALPREIFDLMARWLGDMDECSEEWIIVQRLLLACVSDECILGVITDRIAHLIRDVALFVNPDRKGSVSAQMEGEVWKKMETIALHGMGDDIAALITIELKDSRRSFCVQHVTYRLLLYLCECSLLQLHESFEGQSSP